MMQNRSIKKTKPIHHEDRQKKAATNRGVQVWFKSNAATKKTCDFARRNQKQKKMKQNEILVVAGAVYYVENKNIIVTPHYTGVTGLVDCTVYSAEESINEDSFIYGGETYYSKATYEAVTVDDKWELLSDLKKLYYVEENRNFDE